FIKSPVLCCGEDITFNQVAKFTVPLHFYCQMASELITVWPVITRSRWGYWVISFHENTQLTSGGLLRQ
ncbi:hypothetical protein, partial [Escherichia coli]|uniref:hypothetical protein n=1 Tax=Escherichia coli TaxID=562 RepID=UPI001A7E0CFD